MPTGLFAFKAALDGVITSADAATAAIRRTVEAGKSIQAVASDKFADLVNMLKSSKGGGMSLIGGPDAATLINDLESAIRDQRTAMKDPRTSTDRLIALEERVQKVLAAINQFTSTEITLQKFKQYMDDQAKADATQAAKDAGQTRAEIGDASTKIQQKVEGSGKLVLGSLVTMSRDFTKKIDDAVKQITKAIPIEGDTATSPKKKTPGGISISNGHISAPVPLSVLISTGQLG